MPNIHRAKRRLSEYSPIPWTPSESDESYELSRPNDHHHHLCQCRANKLCLTLYSGQCAVITTRMPSESVKNECSLQYRNYSGVEPFRRVGHISWLDPHPVQRASEYSIPVGQRIIRDMTSELFMLQLVLSCAILNESRI